MACLVFFTVLQECVAVSPLYKQALSCRICMPWQVHVVRQLAYCKNLVHRDLRMPNDIQLAQHQYMVIGLESCRVDPGTLIRGFLLCPQDMHFRSA